MSNFKEGDKAIIWAKNSTKYNGTVVTLTERIDRDSKGYGVAWCRVNKTNIRFIMKAGKTSWVIEELMTKSGVNYDEVEIVWAESALRPYDPPSEHTPESLMESLGGTIYA